MSTRTASPRRRLLLWGGIGAAGILVAVAGVVGLNLVYGSGDAPHSQPATSTPVPTATPAVTDRPSIAGGVNGCLGGDSRSPQAVLDAQASAPHTPEGAVSFAIAFSRWLAQKPAVPQSEVALIGSTAARVPNLAEVAASAADVDAAQFHVTSLNGFYRIDSFTDDRVELTLMLPLVVAGAIDPTLNLMPSTAVVWTDKGWVIEDGTDVKDANTLRTTGLPIPGAC